MRAVVWLLRVRVKPLCNFVIIAVAKFLAQLFEGQRAVRICFSRPEGFKAVENAGGGRGDHASWVGADF